MPDTSTLAPFAGVDALINQSVGQLLSNAVAVYQDGTPFGVLFTRAGDDPSPIETSRSVSTATLARPAKGAVTRSRAVSPGA